MNEPINPFTAIRSRSSELVGLHARIGDHDWQLLSQRGLYWHDHQMLLVADLHLGKDATFRSASVGVPRGATQATLDDVSTMLSITGASELMILGDLFHSRSSLSDETVSCVRAWLQHHRMIEMTLIRGNHDRHVGPLPNEWGLTVIEDSLHIDDVVMTHFPGPCPETAKVLIAGHLHPADVMAIGGESTGKLPCFWLHDGCLTLPACGHFTGTARIERRRGDRVWLVAGDQVIERSV